MNGNPSFTSDASSVDLTISFSNDLTNGIYKYMFDVILTSSQSVKVFLYGECGETGYNVTYHGMIIGMVVLAVALRKMMLTVVTFIEEVLLTSTFRDSFDIWR